MKRFIFRALDQYAFKSFGHQQWKAGVQHGIICEQQRIIKLFESRSQCSSIRGHDWNGDCYCEHIVLIKGEK